MGIKDLINVLRERNYYYDRTIVVPKRQIIVVERQVAMAKNKLKLHKNLTILEQHKPYNYDEQDVWVELETLNLMLNVRMKCYKFLC